METPDLSQGKITTVYGVMNYNAFQSDDGYCVVFYNSENPPVVRSIPYHVHIELRQINGKWKHYHGTQYIRRLDCQFDEKPTSVVAKQNLIDACVEAWTEFVTPLVLAYTARREAKNQISRITNKIDELKKEINDLRVKRFKPCADFSAAEEEILKLQNQK